MITPKENAAKIEGSFTFTNELKEIWSLTGDIYYDMSAAFWRTTGNDPVIVNIWGKNGFTESIKFGAEMMRNRMANIDEKSWVPFARSQARGSIEIGISPHGIARAVTESHNVILRHLLKALDADDPRRPKLSETVLQICAMEIEIVYCVYAEQLLKSKDRPA